MAKAANLKSYQQMAKELAGYIEWFEGDAVNLDEAVQKYEKAMELLEQMERHLKTAQNKIIRTKVKFE